MGTYMLIYPKSVHGNKVLRYSNCCLALFANLTVKCRRLLDGSEINAPGARGVEVRHYATSNRNRSGLMRPIQSRRLDHVAE